MKEYTKEGYKKIVKDMCFSGKKHMLLEFPTGYGKSRIAIEFCKEKKLKTVLIVIPKLVLIKNWEDEILKWKYHCMVNFSTYVSLPKHSAEKYDAIIFDEAHHLSERSTENLPESKYNILLSATVNRNKKLLIDYVFNGIQYFKVQLKEAIKANKLPDPKICLIPLILDTTNPYLEMIERPKAKKIVECTYIQRWKYLKDPTIQLHIKCTERQFVNELGNKIDFYKGLYMRTHREFTKNKWLYLAGQRLNYLSNFKTDIVKNILNILKDKRVLVFCSSIEQTEKICDNCINSDNKESDEVLKKFNIGVINHISSVAMLDEGVNLVNCQVGLFSMLNASERIQTQRVGKILPINTSNSVKVN